MTYVNLDAAGSTVTGVMATPERGSPSALKTSIAHGCQTRCLGCATDRMSYGR